MSVLIDGLVYFFHNGDYGEEVREIIDSLEKNSLANELSIIKDMSFKKGRNLSSFNIKKLNIDRIKGNYSEIVDITKNKNYDIYHCFNNGFSLNSKIKAKKITSINTLYPLYDEELCNKKFLNRFLERLPISLNLSDKIIVSSYFQKNLLKKYYNIDNKKLDVLYPKISKFYSPRDKEISKVYLSSKFKITEDFLFFNGDLHRRKNIEEVIFFFKTIKERAFINDKLIISVREIHKNKYEKEYLKELKELANMLDILNDVIFLINISKADELHLLNMAKSFIDLSRFEDFNLNILKAFLCNTAIIAPPLDLYIEMLEDYPNYYNFEEEEAYSIYLKADNKDIDDFSFLKERLYSNDSILELKNIYNNLRGNYE
ncbi:glycosyltransferase [Clostridium mediterraneense]|uniref:glycosyltransferase n=1 Tax=Clostridium mediterraneense TaxID=1805472 RepID=UPI0008378E91|nr:glycosyltransferase [Clostridium mediterraneense]